jgi:Clusterin-associated protein-1
MSSYPNLPVDFTDMLRTLGYPRFISIESFRKPNFPLVADILVWLLSKFDVEIPAQYGTEQQRVILIRTAAEMLVSIFSSQFISVQWRHFRSKGPCDPLYSRQLPDT